MKKQKTYSSLQVLALVTVQAVPTDRGCLEAFLIQKEVRLWKLATYDWDKTVENYIA